MSDDEKAKADVALQGDHSFEKEVEAALAGDPQKRGSRSRRRKQRDAVDPETKALITSNAKRIADYIASLNAERDEAVSRYEAILNSLDEGANTQGAQQQLDEAKKKPTSISLVKAFLTCDPSNRTSYLFSQALYGLLKENKLAISDPNISPEKLLDMIERNLRLDDMEFIGQVLGNSTLKSLRVATPQNTP